MTCEHFGVCGGCRCEPSAEGRPRPLPYSTELARKEERVRTLLGAYSVGEWRPMIPAPEEWHYRNKMEYAFGVWDEHLVLGLRETGRFDHIVDLQTCCLMSPESLEVLKRVRQWANQLGLTGYHRRRHEGDLRYLVLREGKNTGQRMALLITTSSAAVSLFSSSPAATGGGPIKTTAMGSPPVTGGNDVIQDLRQRIEPLLSTCWLGVTDDKGDNARATDMRLLWGPGTIQEKLGSITYRISPYSFFQTNTRGTEKLYDLLKDWATPHPHPLPPQGGEGERVRGAGALLDFYCGSGGMTLALAGSFDRVVGIDTNRDAIEDAKQNAEANGIDNAEFVCEDALEFLKKLPGSKLSIQLSAMVVDPPRPGLHPKALQSLLEMNPARLAYVSCNPESLARDLQTLVPLYKIGSVQPVDLFPHTAHVETVALLEHR